MKKMICLMVLLFTTSSFAMQSFMPKNDMFIGSQEKSQTMSKAIFNQCVDDIEGLYKPLVRERFEAKLKVVRKWDDGTVNAYALQRGKTWEVHMFGGLARHKAITPDGFRAVICHELGHHMGGAPKIAGWRSKWASNEGQSDYFATTKCLKRFFQTDLKETLKRYASNKDESIESACLLSYSDINEKAICVREIKAGISLATLLASGKKVSIETPDSNIVESTRDKHPKAQCRLDTYLAGALCVTSVDEIPSASEHAPGYCMRNEGYENGVRPLCWYKPKE